MFNIFNFILLNYLLYKYYKYILSRVGDVKVFLVCLHLFAKFDNLKKTFAAAFMGFVILVIAKIYMCCMRDLMKGYMLRTAYCLHW